MVFFLLGAFIIWALLYRVRVHVCLTLEKEWITAEVTIWLFLGLLRRRFRVRLSFFPFQLYVGGRARKFPARQKKSSSLLMKAILQGWRSWLAIPCLTIGGTIGRSGDATGAIWWAGGITIFLQELLSPLFTPETLCIQVFPVFGLRCFCLNMEGIGIIRPWQIIAVAIRQQISIRRGKKIWRTPLKTS